MGRFLQEVVHSARTEEAEVAKLRCSTEAEWTPNAPRSGATPLCDGL